MRVLRRVFVIRPVGALLVSAVISSGCTTMRAIPLPRQGNIDPGASAVGTVSAGDEVRITLRDGRQLSFKVRAVDATALVGDDGVRYEAADILTLERKSFSGTRTAILIVAGVATFVLLAYAAAVASLGGNF